MVRELITGISHAAGPELSLGAVCADDAMPRTRAPTLATYYEGVITWLEEDSDRSVRRIIAVRNERMHA